ncbi:hypothetical protein EYZ11_010453 [Aspergillus tanneri]|uniref:BZIP domain-containing protein n=1 Tax=Aspergillus tanneri TaxID=1220188 RepID=A0A4S3J5C0_9EURO|nr:hypothetical protein EYZ11_010453 [Aspergillus tanneri]
MTDNLTVGTQHDASAPTTPERDSVGTHQLQSDDWKGLTDPKERRRRQNRVNQRAYRRRKRAQSQGLVSQRDNAIVRQTSPNSSSSQETFSSSNPDSTSSISTVTSRNSIGGRCIRPEQASELLEALSNTAYQSYILGSPTAEHLLTLSKMNVFRAFGSILTILGMKNDMEWLHDDAISPFTTMQPGFVEDEHLPINLRPTQLQRRIEHHPWLDFFPHPKMRDNLVAAGEGFDDEQLCIDIMGFWDMSNDSCSLLILFPALMRSAYTLIAA